MVSDADNNPLNRHKSTPLNSGDLKLPPLPKVKALVQENGMMGGLEKFDQQAEEWRQHLERTINERLAGL